MGEKGRFNVQKPMTHCVPPTSEPSLWHCYIIAFGSFWLCKLQMMHDACMCLRNPGWAWWFSCSNTQGLIATKTYGTMQ